MNFHNFQYTTSLSTFVSVLILRVQETSSLSGYRREHMPFACCQETWQFLYLELHTKGPLRQITSCGCVVYFCSLPFWSKWECIGLPIYNEIYPKPPNRHENIYLAVWMLFLPLRAHALMCITIGYTWGIWPISFTICIAKAIKKIDVGSFLLENEKHRL